MVRFCVVLALLVSLGLGSGVAEDKKKDAPKDKKESPIVGTWEAMLPEPKGAKVVLSFTADGKLSQEVFIDKDAVPGSKKDGTYKFADKKLTASVDGKEKELEVKELTDSKMVIVADQLGDLTFTKQKK
jgi:uncharacterized protein (TIGR03066 family)